MAAAGLTDGQDELLFSPLGIEAVNRIRAIEQNLPLAKELDLRELGTDAHRLEDEAWARLGQIVGNASCLVGFRYSGRHLSFDQFGPGFGRNQSLKRLALTNVDLRGNLLGHLGQFLLRNTQVRNLHLVRCRLDSEAIDLLSNALLDRPGDDLEHLKLSSNPLGEVNLDKLFRALRRNMFLRKIDLDGTGMGKRGVVSLAKLLDNRVVCMLRYLDLSGNSIDDAAVSSLVDVLANSPKSTELQDLDLSGNDGITVAGWSTLLNFVCNRASINDVMQSNCTLVDVGIRYSKRTKEAMERALGVDDANLLRAALDANQSLGSFGGMECVVMRRKVLWCHARGDLNVGASSIATGALPRVLAWVGGGLDDEIEARGLQRQLLELYGHGQSTNYIQYITPPLLPEAAVGAMMLDSFYRIVRSRPELCSMCSRGKSG